ncbi:unnamed protein product [Dicrocoelium dendriticum]|nr:unnamed protein product [Dicrocoelium dendriticum]
MGWCPRKVDDQFVPCLICSSAGLNALENNTADPNWQPPNIVLLVGGTRFGGLWPAAGLSSSSALVVASAIAVMHASGLQIDRLALADLCARCERYIGIQGGGMDQAASLLGTEGCAILVEFTKPFVTVHPVPLPLNLVFVVAHSGVHARKAATSMYNQRVSECRIASKILTKNSPRPNLVHDAHPLCLQDAQHAWGLPKPGLMLTKGNSTLPSVVDRFLKPGALTRDDIAAILDDDEIDACLVPSTANMEKFHLLARAVHVYSEAERTMQFYQLCRSFSIAGDTLDTPELPRQLGDLMNESHQSCDSMYDCSCPALNELTSVCRSGGALGSRLTGAGWGGSTVSLIPKDKVADFIEHLRRGYYEKRDLECDSLVFVSRPGPPAGIMRIS